MDESEIPESEQGDLEDPHVPADLLELHQVLEWQVATGELESYPDPEESA